MPDLAAIVDRLVAADLLLTLGDDLERRDAAIARDWRWGHPARLLHYSTRRTRFETDRDAEDARLITHARLEPPPSPFLHREGARIPLPRSAVSLEQPLGAVLRARRTTRVFRRRRLDLARFAALLEWTWGASRVIDDPAVGRHILRTSPSGGARHPIEVYALVIRVEGIARGIYHYDVQGHGLEQLEGRATGSLAVELCAGQEWVADAPALFLMTAVLPRSMWKYSQDHAYRVIHLDAGHLGQTFHLVSTALGLGPFTSGALDQRLVEATLGIDGVTEVPLYAAAAGLPADIRR